LILIYDYRWPQITFKDLKKFISNNIANSNNQEKYKDKIKLLSERFATFRNKPFWITDVNEHKKADIANKGACCFNHIIGLPKKDGVEKPIFNYEVETFHALEKYQNVFIKKACSGRKCSRTIV
jgi:hypothetical protein